MARGRRAYGGQAPRSRREVVGGPGRRRLGSEQPGAPPPELARLGIEPVADPVEAFAQEMAHVIALRKVLADQAAALDPTSPRFAAYERALERSGRFLEAWNRLGLDVVKLRHGQVELALGAVRAALDALDLTAEQRAMAQAAAAAALRGRGASPPSLPRGSARNRGEVAGSGGSGGRNATDAALSTAVYQGLLGHSDRSKRPFPKPLLLMDPYPAVENKPSALRPFHVPSHRYGSKLPEEKRSSKSC